MNVTLPQGNVGSSSASNLLKNPIVGVLLLLAGLALLIWNEGRADYSQIAATSTEIDSETPPTDNSLEGKLVSVSGLLTTVDLISDGQYLKPGQYVALERTVEMYAWIEHKNENKYDYDKAWLRGPADARTFANPQGHENPVMAVREFTTKANNGKVGAFSVDMASVTIPGLSPLQLTADKVIPYPGVQIAGDDYLFVGRGTSYAPQVGDLRIKYSVLESNIPVTVFGALRGKSVATFTDEQNNSLHQIVRGNRAQALSALKSQQETMTWVARAIGLLVMWGGLMPIFRKVSPNMAMGKLRLVTFVIALVLAVVGVFAGISIA
ncbi:hypothetical protein HYW83_00545 [Candidatus Peregrinibacteria bacterium]|nr:hypothetical protein [Candidatus Peregrinibacteria bacterium]